MQKSITITAIENCCFNNEIDINEVQQEWIADAVDDVKSAAMRYYEGVSKDAAHQFRKEYKNHLVTSNLLEECRTNLGFQTRLANDFRERFLKAKNRQRRADNFVFFLIVAILFISFLVGVKMHS